MMKELVDGFAHEVKNPLTSIRGALRILQGRMAPEDPTRQVVEQIGEQVGEINQALTDLLEFTRIEPPEPSVTDLNSLVEQALERIQSACQRQGIRIEKHLSDNLPEIEIDSRQVGLAFLHLFLDTLKVMPKGGKLALRSAFDPQGHLLLEIEDTGGSIPEIYMERLFKPFRSTMGRGAGTGLSIAKRILDQNGGFIEAKNRGEEGITFRISFPLVTS